MMIRIKLWLEMFHTITCYARQADGSKHGWNKFDLKLPLKSLIVSHIALKDALLNLIKCPDLTLENLEIETIDAIKFAKKQLEKAGYL